MIESRCPYCGYRCDSATMLGGNAAPSPGDVTICIECQSICVFDAKLKMRTPTDSEMYDIAGDRRIIMAQRALASVKKSNRA